MKKTLILALALVASASFSHIDAAKKKKKDATAQPVAEVVAPAQLVSGSDSLSYVAGMSLTNGLIPYLVQSQGIDTALMADFVRGFEEVMKAGDNPQQKAYLAGMDIASQVRQRMLPQMQREFTDTPDTLVSDLLYRGFTDALQGDTTHFQQKQAEDLFKQKQAWNKAQKEERLYGANREAGRQFLADNAKNDDVIKCESGLQYKVLVQGDGEVPQLTDNVKVHYEGRLLDGTVFDASRRYGDEPATFRPDQVIKGWTEALTMMPVGSKWQLYIPYELAYGERGSGPQIQPYSMLIFDVELIGIDKPEEEKPAAKPVVKKSGKRK